MLDPWHDTGSVVTPEEHLAAAAYVAVKLEWSIQRSEALKESMTGEQVTDDTYLFVTNTADAQFVQYPVYQLRPHITAQTTPIVAAGVS